MQRSWWKESVVYQIYPRSFQDSNGDGVGDLRGIIARLDYLQQLGVDVVWLSPVYQSPNDDNGYDISDYQAINPEFGTLADWEALLEGMHQRGIKLVMDLVVNHTSDEHPWFVASRSARDNPYRDWYIWRSGKDGREPNNWGSFFGGSAWTYDEATGEYYLHLFSQKQPDLNWENPQVRQAIYALMHWWLRKGVDGFRMDVINLISKAPGLPDAPVTGSGPYQSGAQYFAHGPRLGEFLAEMKREVLAHYDLLTVGEMPMATCEQAATITNEATGQLQMVFQFEHMDVDIDHERQLGKWAATRLRLADLRRTMSRWQHELAGIGWNSLYLSNHDQPRPVSRFGDDTRYRVESAKLLATFLHMLQGTPYIYQGEEIGMTNVRFATIDAYRDIETLHIYRELVQERGLSSAEALAMIHARGRDNARTPMQWDDSAYAGFSSAPPWIGVNPNYRTINVAAALADPDSVLHYYQRLITLRKTHPLIVYGSYALLLEAHAQIYAFTRTLGDQRLLVLLNFSADSTTDRLPAPLTLTGAEMLISNYPQAADGVGASFSLRPYEARVYQLGVLRAGDGG